MQPKAIAQRAALTAILSLPRPVRRLIAGPERTEDGQSLDLDAQVLARLDQLLGGALDSDDGTAASARDGMAAGAFAVAGRRQPVAVVRNELLAGPDGHTIPARRYVPLTAERPDAGPLVAYFHGGGWVCGDLDTHDNTCRAIADATGATVVAVDYRLAPESPYPAALDDAFAAYADLRARAGEFGADPERIAVAGDSAGGWLAAMVCLRAAAEGIPQPSAQVLIYPVTDLVEQSRSYHLFSDGLLLTEREMQWFKDNFVPDVAARRDASPLYAELPDGLAPAFVLTAGFDPLRDEGEAYARALSASGAPVHMRRYPGQVHGFINALGVGGATREAIGEIAGVLRLWWAQAPDREQVSAR
ncbi:MAG: alpha/beta hydrolase [Baekduia sp.]